MLTRMFLRILFAMAMLPCVVAAEVFIVKDGRPQAQIIIAPDPPRTVHLAARELQVYLKKISGAELDIVTRPGDRPVRIYVGESDHTRRLGIRSDDLPYGAYRMVSGESWLALIGQDSDFTPIEPWPRGNADIASGRMQAAWDKITGAHWGYMLGQLHKHYSGRNALFGTEREEKTDAEGNVNVWTYDERGSFNAVCGFLRDLGVRWYMPGEIGEVLPRMSSIALPEVNRAVHPDFPLRVLNFRAGLYGRDVMMWGFRLGVRQPYGRQAAHGLRGMTDNEATFREHPDWFALYGGRRHNQPNIKNNQLCYSNQELLREAVRFARVQFDHFKMDAVSIMPPDGYTAICQCSLCEGKESPELGPRGRLSNYVWDFVNRVAREVRKTHPDRRISCCAYGVYTEPPSNIEKLEPNVQVIIVGGRRPLQADREDLRRLRRQWRQKTDRPLEIFENYPFTGRGWYLPAYIPRVLGQSINETKGISRGEDIWITMDFSDKAVGFNHFLLYFTGRMYWGGQKNDPAELFDEYVEKFYGPVAPQMRAFFAWCEQHWREMETDADKANRALELIAAARAAAPEGSLHARRVALIDKFLDGLRAKARQLEQKRGPVPTLRLVSGAEMRGRIAIDGRLDDGPWVKFPAASTGRLRELQTGRRPTFGTSFKAEWIGSDLYFAIRCEERPGEKLNIATTKSGDPAIWYGDCVEIELATDAHSYYQIAVNPAGALVDLDRGAPRSQWFNWSSQAEVATRVADDHWTVEIRLPVTRDANDPLHQIVGQKPTQSLPWFVNVCRQRVRDKGTEHSAFSPTGAPGFHAPLKFAHFYAGRSHRFEFDPSVTDFIIAGQAAEQIVRARKWKAALNAFLALADTAKATDFQKSIALQQAARCAAQLKDYPQAEKVAARIPIEAVRKTARMQTLAAQRKWRELIDAFGAEDLSAWPFWQIAQAAFERGRAHYQLGNAEATEAALSLALEFESDPRQQVTIRTLMGLNRETRLKDEAGALELYRRNFEGKQSIGAADEYRSVHLAALIHSRNGRHEQALQTLGRIDTRRARGYWRHATLQVLGDIYQAAGRTEDARAAWQQIVDDPSAAASLKKSIAARLESLHTR